MGSNPCGEVAVKQTLNQSSAVTRAGLTQKTQRKTQSMAAISPLRDNKNKFNYFHRGNH